MSQQPERIHKKFHIDRTLMLLLLAMTCVSLLAIYCADPIMATRLQGTHLWLKQGMWYAIGFLMLAFLTRFGSDRLFTGVKIFYWILMVLLAILLVDKYVINLPDRFIRPVNGTTAWYQIPGLGTFQPSEFMKVVLIIMVANIIHEHNLGKLSLIHILKILSFATRRIPVRKPYARLRLSLSPLEKKFRINDTTDS